MRDIVEALKKERDAVNGYVYHNEKEFKALQKNLENVQGIDFERLKIDSGYLDELISDAENTLNKLEQEGRDLMNKAGDINETGV